MPEVYLLHFNKPYWANARHYIGYTKFTAAERCKLHREGKGSRLVDYALRHGCAFVIAHAEHFETKQEARARERRIKKNGRIKNLCPICNKKGVMTPW